MRFMIAVKATKDSEAFSRSRGNQTRLQPLPLLSCLGSDDFPVIRFVPLRSIHDVIEPGGESVLGLGESQSGCGTGSTRGS